MNLARNSRKAWINYGVALLMTLAAAVGALVLERPLLELSPFLLFYAAVALSSWFGGTGPGLLAVGLGALTTTVLILPPVGHLHMNPVEATARLCLFVAVGALIACLNGALRRANERWEKEAQIARRNEAQVLEQQDRLQLMASELMLAEERERRRIATVLHDAVVQMLALSKMKVDVLRRELQSNGVHQQLEEVYMLIDRSIAHTRSLTAELSPPVLYEIGLAAAIQWLGDRFREEHGISFTLADDRSNRPINDETRLVLFHAVRELLVNVFKHAHAARCGVNLRRVDSEIEIVVWDNGHGFTTKSTIDYSSGGFGLFNIRQRLSHLGGKLNVRSEPGQGTTATIRAPLIKEVVSETPKGAS